MGTATLTIDLNAIVQNWRALDAMSGAGVETGACVKADAYGLGITKVAPALATAGVKTFFVAVAEEGAAVRQAVGNGPRIMVFSGHMAGDSDMIGDLDLIPMINSIDQMTRHVEALPNQPFGIQLDTGMNRLGIEPSDWSAMRDIALARNPVLVMSHLAEADDPASAMNATQLAAFQEMTDGIDAPRSLAATGGILLGDEYHFDMCRPGIGLYGGLPFEAAASVVELDAPIIQTRRLSAGETVGYGGTWSAESDATIATISGGYADGLIRSLSNAGKVFADGTECPIVGRVSMDLIGVDVSHLSSVPDRLTVLGPDQTVDAAADAAGTIGYEILTSLGQRYARLYKSVQV